MVSEKATCKLYHVKSLVEGDKNIFGEVLYSRVRQTERTEKKMNGSMRDTHMSSALLLRNYPCDCLRAVSYSSVTTTTMVVKAQDECLACDCLLPWFR